MLPSMAATARQPSALAARAPPFASARDRRRLSQRSATTSGAASPATPRVGRAGSVAGSQPARAVLDPRDRRGYAPARLSSRPLRAVREPASATPVEPSEPAGDAGASHEGQARGEEFELQRVELARLRPLRDAMLRAGSDLASKEKVIASDPRVAAFLDARGPVARVLPNMGSEEAYLVKCVVAIGQEAVLDSRASDDPIHVSNALRALCATLKHVEAFYDMLGGLVGYQFAALELIHEAFGGPPAATSRDLGADAKSALAGSQTQTVSETTPVTVDMHVPPGPDLREGGGEYARLAASWGLRELPKMAEVYPLGGAGDRLGLEDPKTGESLPAALLNYNGRTLIEGLLRDLTAREWLYYKTFGEHVKTPVAIMTSAAKGNHARISSLIREKDFFGRGESGFRLFEQPLVPVVTVRGGAWVVSEEKEMSVALKPGGHGAIWKLMHDQGVFTWLGAKKRVGATVRQITNPMAGTDTTIFALSGVGARENKAMGFASCERHLGAAEGVNVLVERGPDAAGRYAYGVSNVEYTVLQRHGISDEPVAPGSSEARFPANTNVLYIGLEKIQKALESSPRGAFPGMLVNLSKPVTKDGVKGGRLETSMQNIADALEGFSKPGERLPPSRWGELPTFVLYSSRRRITSSAKKKRDVSKPPSSQNLAQTPDGSFLDLLRNASDLLDKCGVAHPAHDGGDTNAYVDRGPGFIFCADPAIGPLWDVTAQKIRGGKLHDRAEVRLEIAETQWRNVEVSGSLLVTATAPLGGTNGQKVNVFDDTKCGRARLLDVTVRNKGVDWSAKGTQAWSATLTRKECCEVTLRGNAEFDARGVKLEGDVKYDVPAGKRLELFAGPGGPADVVERWSDLASDGKPSWQWRYALGEGGMVELELEEAPATHSATKERASATRDGKENVAPESRAGESSAREKPTGAKPSRSNGFVTRKGSVGKTAAPVNAKAAEKRAPTSR
jgi:hypothetical protein